MCANVENSSESIVRTLLHGHTGVIAVIHAYLDETGTHDSALMTSMAAYLFDAEQALIFTKEWDAVLSKFRPRGIEYFHAVDCLRTPRKRPFDVLTDEEATAFGASLVALIRQTARIGIVRFVVREDWNDFVLHSPVAQIFTGSAYTACGVSCVEMINDVLEQQGYAGDVFYYFESGNEDQGELAHFLSRLSVHPQAQARYRCGNVGFYEKKKVAPLQAADLLAWEWQRAYMNATVPGRTEWRTTLSELTSSPLSLFASGFSRESIDIQAMKLATYGITAHQTDP